MSGRMSSYQRAIRFALSRQANAYGFTLIVWGTGALATWKLGKPDPADVFAFVAGGLLSICAVVALAFGIVRPFQQGEPQRRPFSAMHLPSVPAAMGAGWAMTYIVGGPAGFFLAAFIAVGLYEVLLAAEVAAALAPNEQPEATDG